MDPCTLQREKANSNVTNLFKRTIVQPGVRSARLIPECPICVCRDEILNCEFDNKI